MEYTHLHGHSTYSFLEAIGTPKKLISRAKELGFKALGLTDLFSFYGVIQLYENARENEINPIIGTEVGFVLNMEGYNKVTDIGNICFLAKNREGYQNLMKILSIANQKGIAGKPKIDISVLEGNTEGIIAFMGGDESWIGKMIARSEKEDKIMEILNMLIEKLGKENIYLEIIAQNEAKDSLTKTINNKTLQIAEGNGIKVIVDNIYKYIDPKDKETREMALAIKDGKKMYDSDRRKPVGEFHLMTGDEIREICINNGYPAEKVDSWIQTNNDIADMVNIDILMHQALFPIYQTPKDVQELYDNIKDSLITE